jgi:hypothetical protein
LPVGVSGMGKESRALLVIPGTLTRASSEPAPWRDLGGLERHVILPGPPGNLMAEGGPGQLWPSPGRLLRRVLSEERGECCSPPPKCGHSRATPRGATHPLNRRRCQPSQSTDPHQPAFALGSPVGVGIEGLAGEVESSCSHPREAMNLVHVRRISRRNRTAS